MDRTGNHHRETAIPCFIPKGSVLTGPATQSFSPRRRGKPSRKSRACGGERRRKAFQWTPRLPDFAAFFRPAVYLAGTSHLPILPNGSASTIPYLGTPFLLPQIFAQYVANQSFTGGRQLRGVSHFFNRFSRSNHIIHHCSYLLTKRIIDMDCYFIFSCKLKI